MRTLVFLGTGTSVGVPMVGCDCAVCTSANPKNNRMRCSVVIQLTRGNILIDTSPELRLQLLRERISRIDAVLYTHFHADHLFGLDDLRPLCKNLDHPMPLYCSALVEEKIRDIFPYALVDHQKERSEGFVPQLKTHRIDESPFTVLGHRVTPIPLEHAKFEVFGFRLDNMAYCTDVSRIPDCSWPLLQGLDVLVLDALRFKPHPAHLNIDQAVEIIRKLKPQRAFLTHMTHDLEHEAVNSGLPSPIQLAYDGLKVEF